MYYKLDKKTGQLTRITVNEFSEEFQKERHIGDNHIGEVRVSTVFLVMDHGFNFTDQDNPNAAPLVFETMIFGGKHHEYQERYTCMFAAKKRHREIVAALRKGLDP